MSILPTRIECRGQSFSFAGRDCFYVSDATFNGTAWTALANINGFLCLVEVRVSISEI